ncbi:MAG: DUF4231 domain-containing protein [Actinocatenispora sp.]
MTFSLKRLFRRKTRKQWDDWQQILDKDDRSWHPDHIKSRILDAEEQLVLHHIWKRIGLTWAILGNIILIGVAIAANLISLRSISQHADYLYLVLVLSLVGSPLLVYFQFKTSRKIQLFIKKLNIVLRRNQHLPADTENEADQDSGLPQQKRYREDVQDVIEQLGRDANRYRKVNNRFQSVIIIGSVLTSAITTASVSFSAVRWVAVVISAIVGLAAGFTGYFKYRERSYNLQQSCDAIEREYQSVELRVGKYLGKSEKQAYATFAEVVERLRDEQSKRQQLLDQPAEVKHERLA